MKTFTQFIAEQKVSDQQIKKLEHFLDKMYSMINVDVEFGRHFIDRVNDERNGKDITIPELQSLFTKTFNKYGGKIRDAEDDWQAVIVDFNSDINVPFIIKWDKRKREFELIAKTTMRKKNFKTPNEKLPV